MIKKSIGVVMAVSGVMAFLGGFGAVMRGYGSIEPTLRDIRYVATSLRADVKQLQDDSVLSDARLKLLEQQARLNVEHRKQLETKINRLLCFHSEDKNCSF